MQKEWDYKKMGFWGWILLMLILFWIFVIAGCIEAIQVIGG